ncbi:MAG: cell filamentation protein Fic [Bacteroidetes bacterium RIFCSPLOWO2_12_FULL_31_6]|nr:MAG: cell filamentation protein Fic [Bacteroidetes bacterium RIFCSPLOWO2_12_FULL_31_6]
MIKKKNNPSESGLNEILLYTTPNGKVKVEIYLQNETIWLTQQKIADLFGVQRPAVSKHLKNIFETGELKEEVVSSILEHTTQHGAIKGKTQETKVKYYNLDAIISVGYRVNSTQATAFRIWATERLKEYIIKGFTMDDERLKNLGGGGYWKELLQRIRDIRSSEKVFYRQVLDIYATSIDYDPKSDVSIEFFKKVQNKIHYAVHAQTAAEVIFNRADAEKEFMGLMTFTGNQPQLKDVVIAKNYLNEKELRALGQIVSGYLDFAERQAEREETMTMKDWATHLDRILTMSGEKLLLGAGTISHDKAIEKATNEYKKYQAKTLSEVEKNYLESLKTIEQKAKKKK